MLSQSQIEDMRFKYGIKSSSVAPKPQEQGMTLDNNPIKQFGTDMVTNAVDAISSAGSKVAANGSKYENSPNALIPNAYNPNLPLGTNLKNTALNVAHDVGAIAGGVVGALGAPVSTAVAPVVKPVISAVAGTDTAQALKSKIDEWAKANPEKAALIGDSANLASFLALGLAPSSNVADLHPIDATKNALGTMANDVKTGVNAVESLGVGATKVAEKVLPTSEGIMQRVARIPKSRQQLFEKVSGGESVGKYLEKRGLFDAPDELVPKLYERFSQSRASADEGLAKLHGTYKDATIGNALSQLLTREKAVSLAGVPSKDLNQVQQLIAKYRRGGLSMSEINDVKRLFERNVKLGYQKTLGMQPEKIAQATNLDTKLREWQFAKAKELGFKELADINKETQLARQLADDLGKEIAGTAGNNALGLTDAILVSGGDPASIAMLITKKTAGSKVVQAKIAELLSKSSKPSTPPTPQVLELPSIKRNPNEIFPQVDKAIGSGLEKAKQGAIDYAKNPKLGMSIEDVSKSNPLLTEARKYKTSEAYTSAIREKFIKEQGFEPSSNDVVDRWWKAKQTQPYIGVGGLNPDAYKTKPFISELPRNHPDLKYYEFAPDGKVILYRGIPKSVNTRDARYGDFFSANKFKAEQYGKVERYELDPSKVKVLGDLEAVLLDETKKLSVPTPMSLTDIWKQAHPEQQFSPEVQRIINMSK